MKREFTATVYVIHQQKVLLHPHKKLGKFLPPGGHLEENETPEEAAKREVWEETGLQICFFKQENLWLQEPQCKSLIRPYLCLLEDIPVVENIPSHQHIDFIYVATLEDPRKKPFFPFRWLSWEEVLRLPSTKIFPDTKKTIQQLFELFPDFSLIG